MVRSEAIPLPLETGLKWLFIRSSNKDQVAKSEPCKNNILIGALLCTMKHFQTYCLPQIIEVYRLFDFKIASTAEI